MPAYAGEPFDLHTPVLVEEVVQWLRPAAGAFIDCTLGLGGHSEALLLASPDITVLGIDRDREALEIAIRRLSQFGSRFQAVHGDFKDLGAILDAKRVHQVTGILADLGVSSFQLAAGDRGFSFLTESPLDMRMDPSAGETAASLIARLGEQELAGLIYEFGEERKARKIARAIVARRQISPILTTSQLAELVVKAARVPGRWRIHPATRTFQALRIAVNRELEGLEEFVSAAVSALEPGGRLAMISFHSLEDRIVKQSFKRESGQCLCRRRPDLPPQTASDELVCIHCGARRREIVLTRRPVSAGDSEIARNPRARSAKMRVCERV